MKVYKINIELSTIINGKSTTYLISKTNTSSCYIAHNFTKLIHMNFPY